MLKNKRRTGVVTVEFAVTAPLLLLVVFGIFEISRAHMIVNSIEAAAFEAARRAIVPGVTAKEIREACQEQLAASAIGHAHIEITPQVITAQTARVTVAIAVPFDANSFAIASILRGQSISRAATASREGYLAGRAMQPPRETSLPSKSGKANRGRLSAD